MSTDKIMHSSDPARLCSVLVPSCDSYSDLWEPFFTQFWKHWPDCPFPVYLGSNALDFEHPRTQVIHSGHGNNWTNRVRDQIESLDTPYVLMILEDFFLQGDVDTAEVLSCFDTLRQLDGKMMRLVPRPKPVAPVAGKPNVGEIPPGTPYRLSTQAAIWRRETLLGLMRESESIWQFELDGTKRAETLPGGFYGVWKPVLTYKHHVVERGKWFRFAARYFGRMNIGCDFTRRGIMSRQEHYSWLYRKVRGVFLDLLPQSTRARLVQAIKGSK